MNKSSTKDLIMDAAERRARANGYHGFSFRDLAEDVGIKSASIHYHFPTKTDLMEAITERYTQTAMGLLTPPKDAKDAISQVAGLFSHALQIDKQMCLCGLLGAERDTIPPSVVQRTSAYFYFLLDYLCEALPDAPNKPSAEMIVSSLEGGLILARNLDNPKIFSEIVDTLINEF